MAVYFSGAVEGILDEAVFRRLVLHVGGELGNVHPGGGRSHLARRLRGYNAAAERNPWFVLVDLDTDECAPSLRQQLLPVSARFMAFRIAVREVEAWLMGDTERFAAWFEVPVDRMSRIPEALDDPKREVVRLCRDSGRREIREGIVPRPGSGRTVGAMYNGLMPDFVDDARSGWRPDVAARVCPSLARALRDLSRVRTEAE